MSDIHAPLTDHHRIRTIEKGGLGHSLRKPLKRDVGSEDGEQIARFIPHRRRIGGHPPVAATLVEIGFAPHRPALRHRNAIPVEVGIIVRFVSHLDGLDPVRMRIDVGVGGKPVTAVEIAGRESDGTADDVRIGFDQFPRGLVHERFLTTVLLDKPVHIVHGTLDLGDNPLDVAGDNFQLPGSQRDRTPFDDRTGEGAYQQGDDQQEPCRQQDDIPAEPVGDGSASVHSRLPGLRRRVCTWSGRCSRPRIYNRYGPSSVCTGRCPDRPPCGLRQRG